MAKRYRGSCRGGGVVADAAADVKMEGCEKYDPYE